MDRGDWRATVHGVARVGHHLVTKQQKQSWLLEKDHPQICALPLEQDICKIILLFIDRKRWRVQKYRYPKGHILSGHHVKRDRDSYGGNDVP